MTHKADQNPARARRGLSAAAGAAGAALAGACLPLSLAPFGFWPLGVASCAALFALTRSASPRAAALLGWAYGTSVYLTGFSWIYVSLHTKADSPAALSGAVTALACVLLGLFYAAVTWTQQRFFAARAWLAFPALWTLSEWLRTWFLTGLPWLFAGYAHIDTPLAGFAPLFGVLALSLMTAASGSALCSLKNGRAGRIFAAAMAAVWLCGALLRQVEWSERVSEQPLRVALIQSNIPASLKWKAGRQLKRLRDYRELIEAHPQSQLLVLHEGALSMFHSVRDLSRPQASPTYEREFALLEQTLRERGQALIAGTQLFAAGPGQKVRFYNSTVVFGEGRGQYRKSRLVPFGEYVPLERWLGPLLEWLRFPMSAFTAGPDAQPPLRVLGDTFLLSPHICYEIAYADRVAAGLGDAQALLTISEDDWFGDSLGPHQHLQIARMRALELGRYVLRATGRGITALIDERGRVVGRLPQFERAVLVGEAWPMGGTTPFARWRSWPAVGLCALILLASLARPSARRSRQGKSL